MGTFFVFQFQGEVSETELSQKVDTAMEILQDADQKFSLYNQTSEISELVSGTKAWSIASSQQLLVRDACDSWKETTSGFFDARAGSEYDPSGFVKTWAAMNACNYLEANGYNNFTLNAGGDIYLSRDLERGVLTRVGLSNLRPISARDSGANLVLELAGTDFHAVATSGSVERGEHIWRKDQTSRFIQASVISQDLVEADIWATALISGGIEAWEKFLEVATPESLVSVAVGVDGSLLASPGFTGVLATI